MALMAGDLSGYLTNAAIVEAIIYAANNGAKVINASFGDYYYSLAEYDAISYANSKGVLFVASAGNKTNDNDSFPFYPASYNLPNIISVAATDQYDQLASFSNYGATSVHVGAPGVSILSTVAGRKTIFEANLDNLSNWTQGCYIKTTMGNCSYTPGNVDGYWEDSPNVPYDNDSLAYLETINPLNFTEEKGISLEISALIDTEEEWDYARTLIADCFEDDESGNFEITPDDTFDISYCEGYTGKLRFELETDESVNNYDGVKLDYVRIESYRTAIIDDLQYYSGSSMAASYVSGLAALIRSLDPSLTVSEVKNKILTTVDVLPSLTGLVSTGGRVNAYNALLSTGWTLPKL